MHSDTLTAPGLKRRTRKSGPPALYWCARADLVKAGFRPEAVRLPFAWSRTGSLRQRDVIGEWPPLKPGEETSGIVYRGRRWTNGLTWADLADDFELRKKTTKTGRFAAHDFKQLPFLLDLLNRVPVERRVGPLVIDEKAKRPYAQGAYGREWRVIARAAGIPEEIKNMDARSGGITEAEDARAELDHIQAAAAHSEAKTTIRTCVARSANRATSPSGGRRTGRRTKRRRVWGTRRGKMGNA